MATRPSHMVWHPEKTKKKTTIGKSRFTRFKSKHDKRNKKQYRGQGK